MTDDEIVEGYRCHFCYAPRGMACVTPDLSPAKLHASRRALAESGHAPPPPPKPDPMPTVAPSSVLSELDYLPSCRLPLGVGYGPDPDGIREPSNVGLSFFLPDGDDDETADWNRAVRAARAQLGLPTVERGWWYGR